jgi:hypothetical protein
VLIRVECDTPVQRPHSPLSGKEDWRDHVADLIAEALEPHRIYVKRGPMGEPVPVELRPEMDATEFYPQHKKQRRHDV